MPVIELLKAVDLVWGLVVSAIGGLAAAVLWLFRQRAAISAEITGRHEERTRQMGELDARVQHIEQRVERAATQEDMASLREQITQTAITLARIEGQIGRQAERDRALTEHLDILNKRVTLIYETLLRKE